MENKIKIIWTSSSICGPVREVNEDTIYPEVSGTTKESFVAGVCDGLGGHKHGEVASSIAINQLEKKFDSVLEVIYSANREILSHQKLEPTQLTTLRKQIPLLPQLTSLDLTNTNLTDDDAPAIVDFFNPKCGLKEIVLKNNRIDEKN